MTDKKNIINPDEDFELEGLSNFVEDLNKEGESPSLNRDQDDIDSILDSGEELPSFLSSDDNDELNLDDLNLESNDDEFEFESNDDFDLSSIDSVEDNKNISDEDNISSEEFKNLVESSSDSDEFSFDSKDDDSDLDLSGITEMNISQDKDLFESENEWDKDNTVNQSDDEDLAVIDQFEFETPVDEFNVSDDLNKDDLNDGFDNFDEDLDDKKIEDIDFDNLPSSNFESDTHENNSLDEDEFESTDNELAEAWGNDSDSDNNFSSDDLDTLLEEPDTSVMPVPVPVPVKESFFSKIKNKFSKKNKEQEVEEDDNLNLKASRDDDDSSYMNLDSNLDNNRDDDDSLLSDEDEANKIEEENNRKAKKGNIIKLSALAVIIAAVAGGAYYYNNHETGFGLEDDMANNDLPVQKPVKSNNGDMSNLNNANLAGNNTGIASTGSSMNALQVADLKKEILAQINSDKTAMEQRISSLEKENSVLKNVINQVQTSIDPDQINRFKIEFNDLNSKTKQLEVQFNDDQSANKVMATNFFAVVKKLNEDIQEVKNTTARQDSLDEQTKRIDNTFKQLVKVKDKAAEDNLTYRVDLIEKRMKFRNPNGDRTFEDKNNVRKVLSEGLFEGDTVKQEQPIPDVKYKYTFVGMIEGVIYLKSDAGLKDFKVGDVLPGYGEVLKINDNGSVETEKLGTVSFK
jgi:hypothetical protein